MPDSKHIRVYVAGLFGDMRAERSQLASFVLPQLQTRCEERGITIELVDLRAEAASEADADARVKSGFVDEINNCRPYFIGLLGDRYGQSVGALDSNTLAREPWMLDDIAAGKSLLELEFQLGALRNPGNARNATFYLRDPAYARKPDDNDAAAGSVETAEQVERLGQLKYDIRNSSLRVRENYRDANALGILALADLTRTIDALITEGPRTTQLSPEDLERLLSATNSAAPAAQAVDTAPESDSFATGESGNEQPGSAAPVSASTSAPRIRLTHLAGSRANTAQEFYFDQQEEVWIGRHPVSHVRYGESDQSVSRAHMKIVRSFAAKGAYILISRGRNGAYINNTEVTGSTGLRDGDIIQVGRGGPVFRFEQFPRPSPKPGAHADYTDPEPLTLQSMAAADYEMAPASSATTELQFDPALAWAMIQAKEQKAEPLGAPSTVLSILKEIPVPKETAPRKPVAPAADMSQRNSTILITVIVIVGLLLAWFILKR